MSEEQGQNGFEIGWKDFIASNPNSWIPTGGNWGGSGWSGGERTDNPNWDVPPAPNAFGQPSQVDTACKQHDIAYAAAKSQPNEQELILQADFALLQAICQINPEQMDSSEKIYVGLIAAAFNEKIAKIDIPMIGLEAIKHAATDLFDTIWGAVGAPILENDMSLFINYIFPLLNMNIPLDESNSFFQYAFATTLPLRRDPLILDLDGDGIETTNVNSGAYFDYDGNDFAEQTGWAAPDDGLLVRDMDGNGRIDNGKELFGDQTVLNNGSNALNGFQALSEYDDNGDGRIDANDDIFSQLKVWQDVDGDGHSAEDELKSLSDAGITAINVGSTSSTSTGPEGNTQTRIGSYEKADGTNGLIANYNLQRDTAYTIAEEWLEVPEDIAALPDLQGSGNVYDLQQAMVVGQSVI
jgi:hypothetical protein